MPYGATMTDDAVRELLAAGKTDRWIIANHRVSCARVRAIREGNPIPLKPKNALGRQIMAWCDVHIERLLPMTATQRAMAIAEAFNCSRTTGAAWENRWRRDEVVPSLTVTPDVNAPKTTYRKRSHPDADAAPAPVVEAVEAVSTKPKAPRARARAATIADVADAVEVAEDAAAPAVCIGNGDTVEIPANYLAALEAVVILTHRLNDAMKESTT